MLLAKQNSNQNSEGVAVYQQAHSSMTTNNEIGSYALDQHHPKAHSRQPSNPNKIKSGSSTL